MYTAKQKKKTTYENNLIKPLLRISLNSASQG